MSTMKIEQRPYSVQTLSSKLWRWIQKFDGTVSFDWT